MNLESSTPPAASASSKQLVKATALAFFGALLLLVVAVLPVEFGIDPIGAGRVLGLLRETALQAETPIVQQGDGALKPVQQGDAALYGTPYRVDSIEIVIEPYEYLEYKYHLAQGASMVFSWTADATLVQEFHGDPDENPDDVHSYDKRPRSTANGSFTAPVTGIHGWFWENPGNTPITIKLASAGFYSYSMEFRSDKTHKRHEVPPAMAYVESRQ